MFSDIPMFTGVISWKSENGDGTISWLPAEVNFIILGDRSALLTDTAALVKNEKTLLVFSEKIPEPGCRLQSGNETHIIQTVKTIRSFSGKIIAFKCVC